MLTELRISNLAILPELEVKFSEGLNVLTGETGAGKSILVDAIGLLAGKRASSDDVRHGTEIATVEGILRFSPKSAVWSELKAQGIPIEGNELILRRTIGADGRSRAFANGWQWTVAGLVNFASRWIDISGQHGQQELLLEEKHVRYLDEYGDHLEIFRTYAEHFARLREIESRKKKFESERAEAARQKEFLDYQLKELKGAELKTGEMEELSTAQQRATNGEKLAKSAATLEELLDGEGGLTTLFGKLVNELRGGTKLDSSLESWMAEAETIQSKLFDLSRQASHYRRSLEFDPAEVDRIEARLAQLQTLSRKYGSIAQAIEERDRIAVLVALNEDSTIRTAELEKEWNEAAKKLQQSADKLTKARKKSTKEFSAEVGRELSYLGMPKAELTICWKVVEEEGSISIGDQLYGPNGAEEIALEMAPNPGEGFKPLAKIASGGELSRILLAIKGIALAGEDSSDTVYLFDEVDSGIGGETAERVGIRLQKLSRGRQVLCVTHLAQIACYAVAHLSVEKRVKGGRTEAGVTRLDERGRREELGRMMGGIEITRKTLEHASELLRRGQELGPGALSR